jgi:hypothetical protein
MATKDITDLQVLEAYRDSWASREPGLKIGAPTARRFPYELLQERTGQPFKVCWRAMERAHGRDLVDYGVNLRSGWLTDKGKALLKEAEGKSHA